MSTFVLIHGAGDVGWSWHLVADHLRSFGHDVIAPDLPADDDSLTLDDYAESVIAEVGHRPNVTVVGHSFGGFTATLVAHRLDADGLILLAAMIPRSGETPGEWWSNTGFNSAVEQQAGLDGGLTGNPDPMVGFFHDVPHHLAAEAMGRERNHPSPAAMATPWPLTAWPDIPTRFILCRDDRFFPADFFRQLVPQRLGFEPEEIDGSHCVALSQPGLLADKLLDTSGTTDLN